MRVLLIGLNSKYADSNLALYYLRESLPQIPDLKAKILEMTVNAPLKENISKIMAAKGDVLAFSAYIWNKERLMQLLPLLRQLEENAVIVLGGPEATYTPEAFPQADIIIRGAGEDIWPQLIEDLNNGKMARRIQPPVGEDIAFAKQWPFPYQEADAESLKNRLIYYETSRGCPFHCSFCLSAAEKRFASLPIEQVKEELDRLLSMDLQTVKFVDRTFNYPPKRTAEILRYLIGKARKGITFHLELKGDLLNDEIMELLTTAPPGYFQAEIGLQSFHEATLKAVGRVHQEENLAQNITRLIASDRLHIHLDLIAGLPYETLPIFKKSFDKAFSYHPHHLQLGFLKLLPGAPLAATAEEHGYIALPYPPYEVLANYYLPYQEMEIIRQVEDYLDQDYNKGRYRLALIWGADQYPGSAFDFFLALANSGNQPLEKALEEILPQEEGFWASLSL